MSPEMPRDFIGMSLPEQPNKYYFTLRSHRIVVESDVSVQIIMEKLQSYKSRVALIFEVGHWMRIIVLLSFSVACFHV